MENIIGSTRLGGTTIHVAPAVVCHVQMVCFAATVGVPVQGAVFHVLVALTDNFELDVED